MVGWLVGMICVICRNIYFFMYTVSNCSNASKRADRRRQQNARRRGDRDLFSLASSRHADDGEAGASRMPLLSTAPTRPTTATIIQPPVQEEVSAAVSSSSSSSDSSSDNDDEKDGAATVDSPPSSSSSSSNGASTASTSDVQRTSFEHVVKMKQQLNPHDSPSEVLYDAVVAYFNLVPTTAFTRAAPPAASDRSGFSVSTCVSRKAAFEAFLVDRPECSFADFLYDVHDGTNPNLRWDIRELRSDSNSDYDDESDVGHANKRVRLTAPTTDAAAEATAPTIDPTALSTSSLSSSSSSSSSTREFSPSFATSTSVASAAAAAAAAPSSTTQPTCKFTFDMYTRMCSNPSDMLLKCVDAACSLARLAHSSGTTTASFKMPSRNSFPTFRDRQVKLMEDPYEFLVQLERAMKYHGVPQDKYATILVACLPDRLMQERVEHTVVAKCTSWEEIKLRFKQMYEDTNYKQDLMMQLDRCTQVQGERVSQYTERFQAILLRISSGSTVDTSRNILECERGFVPVIRAELSKYRAQRTQAIGHEFEFATLNELYETASTLERGLTPRAGRVVREVSTPTFKRTRDGRRRSHVSHLGTAAAVNKIEMNTAGQPVNVNKKHRPHKPANGHARDGMHSRGGFRGGRGGFGGGRSTGPPSGPLSTRFSSASPHRQRAASSSSSTTAETFSGTCFRCHKQGHRKADCPQAGAPSAGGTRK